jgi:hypothetical protein
MRRCSRNYNPDTGHRRCLTKRRTTTKGHWMSINSVLHALHAMAAMSTEPYVTYTVLLAVLLVV